MKITVFGAGYVGLVASVCFADFGHQVLCLESDKHKVELLRSAVSPIYEPGVETVLRRNLEAERLHFTSDTEFAVQSSDIIFLAVGTPSDETGGADMTYVYTAAKEIAAYMDGYKLIINKSTVPVGTASKMREIIQAELAARDVSHPFEVASNPEFLREGKALQDFLNPDRIVVGVESEKARQLLKNIYSVFERSNKPLLFTSCKTAELIKYASNAFLATKITFINEMAELCEAVGADVREVAFALGKDGRISPKFFHAGPGYGGSCFPKDTKALVNTSEEYGINMTLVREVISANEHHKMRAAEKIITALPKGGTVAVWGLSFKPETDDVREAPALVIIRALLAQEGFLVRLYDPYAMENAKLALADCDHDKITWCKNAHEAAKGCDGLAIVTEWMEFRSYTKDDFEQLLPGKPLFDFRNIYSRELFMNSTIQYFATGK